ncbi:MAG: class II aldolase family protein [Candidatus Melainabacteria bacterium]|nr:MAG: class II aldolase family protein [Candidatus Melainabacteria bacterium]
MYRIEQAKKEIKEIGKLVGEKGYSPGLSGNISKRVEDKIVITSSGSSNGFLEDDELTVIDFSGNIIQGEKKASSEKKLHIEFYKQRPDINAIIHVHPVFLCSFAAARIPLDKPVLAENVFYFGQIPLAEYALPSSDELVEKTAKYFKDYNAVLMANHGVIVGDVNFKQAYLKLELAETYAQVVLNTKLLGGAVLLNDKEVEDIYKLR